MKKLRGSKRIVLLVVIIAVVLAITSMLYKRTEQCPPKNEQTIGARLCHGFGPRTYRGFPFGVIYETPKYIEAQQQEGIVVKTQYWPILFNVLFYAMWTVILLVLIKTLKNDKHNNIDMK